jgi:hypothetical protein
MSSSQALSIAFMSARLLTCRKGNCPAGHDVVHSAMITSADFAFRPMM